MSDLDSYMKKYINKNRLVFMEHLETEIFIEGFPGLHTHSRDRIRRYLKNEGRLCANADLLDCIMRIDNFPAIFIQFCKNNDCSQKLVQIIERGINEYQYYERHGNFQAQVNHGATVRQISRHHDDPQIQQLNQVVHQEPHSHHNHHEATNFDDNATLETVDNNVSVDCVNGRNVIVKGNEGDKGNSDNSQENSERLLKQLDCLNICEIVVEHECTAPDTAYAENYALQGLSNSASEGHCPCPAHRNTECGNDHTNEFSVSNENEKERSLSDGENRALIEPNDMSPFENILPIIDLNNIDRNDPIKKISSSDKMSALVVIKNVNLNQDLKINGNNNCGKYSDGNSNSMDADSDRRQSCKHGTFFPDLATEGSANQTETVLARTMSSESYYLTSSDEDEFFPSQSPGLQQRETDPRNRENDLQQRKSNLPQKESDVPEIENLKLFSKSDSFGNISKESIQNNSENMQRFEVIQTSEAVFVLADTGLNDVQCQEDVDKYKIYNEQTEELDGCYITIHPKGNSLSSAESITDRQIDHSEETELKQTDETHVKQLDEMVLNQPQETIIKQTIKKESEHPDEIRMDKSFVIASKLFFSEACKDLYKCNNYTHSASLETKLDVMNIKKVPLISEGFKLSQAVELPRSFETVRLHETINNMDSLPKSIADRQIGHNEETELNRTDETDVKWIEETGLNQTEETIIKQIVKEETEHTEEIRMNKSFEITTEFYFSEACKDLHKCNYSSHSALLETYSDVLDIKQASIISEGFELSQAAEHPQSSESTRLNETINDREGAPLDVVALGHSSSQISSESQADAPLGTMYENSITAMPFPIDNPDQSINLLEQNQSGSGDEIVEDVNEPVALTSTIAYNSAVKAFTLIRDNLNIFFPELGVRI